VKHSPLSTQIARYEVPWRDRDWPLDVEAIFGRRAPLVLEIGFGNGEFLVDLARESPEHDHLGIEVSWGSALRLYRRLDHERSTNVRGLLGEAEAILSVCIGSGQLAAVFVNHPCPWPKERHHERRLIQPGFLHLLVDRMAPGAPLLIATDHADYADWIAEHLEAEPGLESRHATTRVHEIPGRKPTKYQRKAMDQGIADHFFEWRRVPAVARVEAGPLHAAPPPETVPLPDPMPSLTLAGSPTTAHPFAAFSPVTAREVHEDVEVVIKLSAAYAHTGGDRWMVEALTQEGPLRQDFGLMVVRRDDGLLVKLGQLGGAHPTVGVKRAVWHLGRWLLETNPGLELVQHNLGDVAG